MEDAASRRGGCGGAVAVVFAAVLGRWCLRRCWTAGAVVSAAVVSAYGKRIWGIHEYITLWGIGGRLREYPTSRRRKQIQVMAYQRVKSTKPGLEEPQEQVHKIRITLSSKNVKNLEKVCAYLVRGAKDKRLQIKGPVRMPNKVLHITTRKSPCGESTNTWDRFELYVHKQVSDLFNSPEVVKQITSITIEPGVEVGVTIADS
nr:40S ribosomal protein S20-2-like [Ipomoea trifida]